MSFPSRRELFAAAAAVGAGTATFHRAVAATAAAAQPEGGVTAEMVKGAEWVAGVTLTDDERKSVASALTRVLQQVAALNKLDLGNAVPPAIHFEPTPGDAPSGGRGKVAAPTKDLSLIHI